MAYLENMVVVEDIDPSFVNFSGGLIVHWVLTKPQIALPHLLSHVGIADVVS